MGIMCEPHRYLVPLVGADNDPRHLPRLRSALARPMCLPPSLGVLLVLGRLKADPTVASGPFVPPPMIFSPSDLLRCHGWARPLRTNYWVLEMIERTTAILAIYPYANRSHCPLAHTSSRSISTLQNRLNVREALPNVNFWHHQLLYYNV